MCKICQLTMSQAMIMASPEWVCGQCDYSSRSKQRRTRHVNMIHRGMKVHCDVSIGGGIVVMSPNIGIEYIEVREKRLLRVTSAHTREPV